MDPINGNLPITPYTAFPTSKNTAAVPATDKAQKAPNQDTISISAEERQRAKMEALERKQKDFAAQKDQMRKELENANQQTEAIKKETETQSKCMTIAIRIMSGDIVPAADYKYLAEKNSKLYAQAITLRTTRENAKKHKRLSEDEEESNNVSQEPGKVEGGETDTPEGNVSATAPGAGDVPAPQPATNESSE